MSKLLKEPLYQGKNLENCWVNNWHSSHELFCGCNKALQHFLEIINRQNKAPKPPKEIENIICLITGEKEDKDGDAVDNLIDGELEEFFKDEFGDNEKEEETG
nr:MAG: hypothetical protein [Betatorquevirus sp.]